MYVEISTCNISKLRQTKIQNLYLQFNKLGHLNIKWSFREYISSCKQRYDDDDDDEGKLTGFLASQLVATSIYLDKLDAVYGGSIHYNGSPLGGKTSNS